MARPNLNVIGKSLILSIDLNICLAPISDDPFTLTAFLVNQVYRYLLQK